MKKALVSKAKMNMISTKGDMTTMRSLIILMSCQTCHLLNHQITNSIVIKRPSQLMFCLAAITMQVRSSFVFMHSLYRYMHFYLICAIIYEET